MYTGDWLNIVRFLIFSLSLIHYICFRWLEVVFNGFTVATIAFMMTIMDKECEDTCSDIDKNKWQLGCMVGEESSAAALCKLISECLANKALKG